MQKLYAYRTTTQKLEDGTAAVHVQDSGDAVESAHFLGGRDWVLICRSGEPTIGDLTAADLEQLLVRVFADRNVEKAVGRAIERALTLAGSATHGSKSTV